MLKKTIATLGAFTIMAMNPLNASAAITIRDINGDGNINASDAFIINLYVNGSLAHSAPSVLDINNNGIVDVVDVDIYVRYVTTGSY